MKKNISKTIQLLTAVLLLTLTFSCETTRLDINDDPNSLTLDSSDPNYILNNIQLSFAGQHSTLSSISSGAVRHVNQFGTYAAASGAGTMNSAWSSAYSITANLELLSNIASEQMLPNHVGVGQVLEAFAYVNLVDYIGTAVYSEAVNSEFPSPNLDSGESIYDAAYALLDEAIVNLNATNSSAFEDIYFDGDVNKWIKAANTLKLKMYLQSKLVLTSAQATAMNAIVTAGNFISTAADDLQVQYGTSITNPDTRHPFFRDAYIAGAGNTYMSNNFIYLLKDDKTIVDPRITYYLFRQDLSDPVDDLLPCDGSADYQYCYLGDGYWGRDHADDEGIPNDGNNRTTFGIYPGGGQFDTGLNNTLTSDADGLKGAGIHPVMLSSFVHFMLAEAALPAPAGIGATGDAKTYLMEAIAQSFAKVEAVSAISMLAADKAAYTTYVSDEYDAATSGEEKLAIIIREYHIALWGNSLESYNNYRRTGYPDLGYSVESNTDFPRSYFLPSSELNSNDNPALVQKMLTDQVFWDTNAAGFIN
jgi:hypothetical protein